MYIQETYVSHISVNPNTHFSGPPVASHDMNHHIVVHLECRGEQSWKLPMQFVEFMKFHAIVRVEFNFVPSVLQLGVHFIRGFDMVQSLTSECDVCEMTVCMSSF